MHLQMSSNGILQQSHILGSNELLFAGGFGCIHTPPNITPIYSITKITNSSDANEVKKQLEKESEIERQRSQSHCWW